MGPASHRHGSRTAPPVAVGLLTVSDTRTPESDRSGQAVTRLLEAEGHSVFGYRILPDEPDRIGSLLREWLAEPGCAMVIVNGGTGISRRDRTFDAVSALYDQRLDGFGELFRVLSYEEIGSGAMLSRASAGVVRGKPLFSLPGSTAAVELAMTRLILPELGHLLAELAR